MLIKIDVTMFVLNHPCRSFLTAKLHIVYAPGDAPHILQVLACLPPSERMPAQSLLLVVEAPLSFVFSTSNSGIFEVGGAGGATSFTSLASSYHPQSIPQPAGVKTLLSASLPLGVGFGVAFCLKQSGSVCTTSRSVSI